jgi:hypothetical protein
LHGYAFVSFSPQDRSEYGSAPAEAVSMDIERKEKQEAGKGKSEPGRCASARDWEQSEWFRLWLELIRVKTQGVAR